MKKAVTMADKFAALLRKDFARAKYIRTLITQCGDAGALFELLSDEVSKYSLILCDSNDTDMDAYRKLTQISKVADYMGFAIK